MSSHLPQPHPESPDLQQVTAALERAARRARQIAEQTGTQLIVRQPPKPLAEPAAKTEPHQS